MTYNDCMDCFNLYLNESGFHPTNIDDDCIEYGDYTFNIKEIPNWKFGVWWKDCKDKPFGQGSFFAQYEPTIDKFKPTRSPYNATVYISENGQVDVVLNFLDFLKKYKLRAWYRDYHYADYNVEYISGFTILYSFINYKFREFRKEIILPILNRHMYKLGIKLWNKEIEDDIINKNWNLTVTDSGKDCSPRYEIQVEMPIFDKNYQDTGFYGLSKDLQSIWNKHREICNKVAEFFKVWFFPEMSDSACFWNKESHEQYLKELERELENDT